VANPRMLVPKERINPPQENRVRFENTDNLQRTRVPRQSTPNAVVMDDVYDEQMVEQENYYSPDEIFEAVQMDGCETSMYIFEEVDNDPNSKETVVQTRGFVNRSKNKNDSEKENQKDKEKTNEKRAGEKMMDNVGNKKQHLMSNSSQMAYNVVEDLSKLRITLPFTEVVKIPQQRENILRLLDDPSEKEKLLLPV
jgi:DNA-binding LacI/PurR family transcriptional regulator